MQPKILSLLFSVKAESKEGYNNRTSVEEHLYLYGTKAGESGLLRACFNFRNKRQESGWEYLDMEYEIKIIQLLLLIWKKSGHHKMLFLVRRLYYCIFIHLLVITPIGIQACYHYTRFLDSYFSVCRKEQIVILSE